MKGNLNPNTFLPHPLLLIDGVCNLCTASVQFLIRRDSKKILRYASLQSASGARIIATHKISLPEIPDTMILIHNGIVHKKSEAWIEIFRLLGGFWKVMLVFKILPVGFRDACYEWIAKNRYRWFGKRDACYLPTAETRALFLD